jgi:hypothetical protein
VVLDVVQAQALACDETLLAHSLLRQTASVSQRGIAKMTYENVADQGPVPEAEIHPDCYFQTR